MFVEPTAVSQRKTVIAQLSSQRGLNDAPGSSCQRCIIKSILLVPTRLHATASADDVALIKNS
jgi:hypothetical protein